MKAVRSRGVLGVGRAHGQENGMREIVWTGFTTLDGVVDSPGGPEEGHPHGGWVFRTPLLPEAFELKGTEIFETSALLLGRRSYEAFAPLWRGSGEHVDYEDLPKYVVSSSLTQDRLLDGWGPTTILRSTEDVAALRDTDGGALFIHGSAELARRLAVADLIDRYHLLTFPVVLGSGKRLFDPVDRTPQQLVLRDSATYGNGVTKSVYEVAR